MELNQPGVMLKNWYCELPKKYPDKKCREMVIMPNHIHFIIQNGDKMVYWGNIGFKFESDDSLNEKRDDKTTRQDKKFDLDNHVLNSSIGDLVDWFKTMSTNEYIRGVKQYGWKRFKGKLWQRNFYEHIIRSEKDYERIANYINNNPLKWDEDDFNA